MFKNVSKTNFLLQEKLSPPHSAASFPDEACKKCYKMDYSTKMRHRERL